MATALIKVAKHLALLSSLLIVGTGAGQAPASPTTIFFLILFAAVIHGVGRRLERRRLALRPLLLRGP